jgi:hypothetical protein
MKTAIITTLYKRHDLAEIVLDYYNSLKKEFNLILIAAGSEGEESRQLAERNGWEYIETHNRPLTHKHNALSSYLKGKDIKGAVLIGSDDLIAKEQLKFYEGLSENESEIIGFSSVYFFDTRTKELGLFESESQSIGAGRYFSKRILEACNYELWEGDFNRGLDLNCKKRLQRLLIHEKIIKGGLIFDIKHSHNISNIEAFNLTPINKEFMAKKTSKKTAAKVEALEPKEERLIKTPKEKPNPFVQEVEFIKASAGFKIGDKKILPLKLASDLISKGFAK